MLHVGRLMRTLGQDGDLASAPGELWALDPVPRFSPALPQLAAGGGRQGTWLLPRALQTRPSSRWAGAGWVWLLAVETVSLCRQGGRRREGLGAKARCVFWLSSLESEKQPVLQDLPWLPGSIDLLQAGMREGISFPGAGGLPISRL